ncbi:MAG: hypothetical protein QM644_09635 [Mobilitalea sp.]
MKKPYIIANFLFVMLLAVSCAKPSSVSDISIPSITPKAGTAIPESTPLTQQNEYIVLVESYIDDTEFKYGNQFDMAAIFDDAMAYRLKK